MDLLKLIQNRNFLLKFALGSILAFSILFSVYTIYSDNFNQIATKSLNSNFIFLFNSEKEAKFFSDANTLLLYFRHEINPDNPQFSYISVDIRTHFYISFIVFISLIIPSPLRWTKKLYFFIFASLFLWGFFLLKIYFSAETHLLSSFHYDNLGNITGIFERKSDSLTFIQLMDKILNSYSSIGLRPMLTIILWFVMLFYADKKKWIAQFLNRKINNSVKYVKQKKLKLQNT